MAHRTYLKLKALDGDDWIVEGWATLPREDRVGDLVMPEGAQYELPIPLLAQHDHDAPIGAVISASASAAGIRIRAKLTKGVAKAEEMWRLIRDGVMSLSIGFRALDSTPRSTGGTLIRAWEWLELSIVSVPCCPGTNVRVAVGKMFSYSGDRPAPTKPNEAWHRAVEPPRHRETEIEAFYRRFDACAELLPHGMKRLIDVRHTETRDGHLIFLDRQGQPLASVDLKAGIVHEGLLPSEPVAATPRTAGTSAAEVEAMMEAGVRVIGEVVGAELKALRARIDALKDAEELSDQQDELTDALLAQEGRLAALERGTRLLRYRGRWQAEDAASYTTGDVVTHRRCLYSCNRATEAAPGANSGWSLMCRGTDAPPERSRPTRPTQGGTSDDRD